mgnify:CR=1 FL=1|jgi:hypothetical protein
MEILFWLAVASYMLSTISSIIYNKYRKEKIFALAAFILLLSGYVLTFIFGMINQRPEEIFSLVAFIILATITIQENHHER